MKACKPDLNPVDGAGSENNPVKRKKVANPERQMLFLVT
jgi:hypothetical protein